jgi:predicted RNase H-like nuclease (RuvC/YqgF family)
MTEEPENTTTQQELRRLEERILTLEKENAELRSCISTLELQTEQLTDRILRIGGNCSSCRI